MEVNELNEFIESQRLRNLKNGVVIFPASLEIIYGIDKIIIEQVKVQVQELGADPKITFHNFNDENYPDSYNFYYIQALKYMYDTYLLIEDTFKNKPLKIKVFPIR